MYARVWAQWNHSFDMHLSYLGPVSCSFPSWIPSQRIIGGSPTGRWLDDHNILCQLIWQETFFVHTSLPWVFRAECPLILSAQDWRSTQSCHWATSLPMFPMSPDRHKSLCPETVSHRLRVLTHVAVLSALLRKELRNIKPPHCNLEGAPQQIDTLQLSHPASFVSGCPFTSEGRRRVAGEGPPTRGLCGQVRRE